MQFQAFRFDTPATTLTRSFSVTDGFGSSQNFSTTLNLDAMSFTITDAIASHSLSPASGGNYSIQNTNVVNGGYLTAVSTGRVTGSYSITGPTETVTGSFNMPLAMDVNYMLVPNLLNTTNYPSQLGLSSTSNLPFLAYFIYQNDQNEHLTSTTNDNYFVNRVVDGQTVSWSFWRMELSGFYSTVTPGALIPEPTSCALIAGVAAFGACVLRRQRAKKMTRSHVSAG